MAKKNPMKYFSGSTVARLPLYKLIAGGPMMGIAQHTLEVSKVSFVPIDAAVEATGMESGGMSPIGLPDDWPLLVDQHVLSIPKLYLGSGIRPSKLVVDGSIFADIPGVRFVPGLGKPRQ